MTDRYTTTATETTPRRRASEESIEWVRSHGINPNVIPRDGIDILPTSDGRTIIRWEEPLLNSSGEYLWDTPRGEFTEHRAFVAGRPPSFVRAGVEIPVVAATCPHCSEPLPGLAQVGDGMAGGQS